MSSPQIDRKGDEQTGRAGVGTRRWYSALGEDFERTRLAWLREGHPSLESDFVDFREHLAKILADIKGNTPLQYFTDHSIEHSRVNMGILSRLLEHPRLVAQNLTEEERWGLLFGAYLHDHRMVTGLRAGHERISEAHLREIPGLLSLLDAIKIPVEAVQRICELHSSKTKFDRPDIAPLRTSLLGALMRMADSLDYTADRLPTAEFLAGKSISRMAIFEYHKQECVRRIVIDGASIDVFAWFSFENIHLIQEYFEKDYPREFLTTLGITFTYRFQEAEAPPPAPRAYLCSDDARPLDLTSAEGLPRLTEDSAYLETAVTGIAAGLADWPTFRAQMAVPGLFSIEPRSFGANALRRTGFHVITGPPGCGKSVFLLLALEALLQQRETTPVTVRVLPRQRLAEALQGISDAVRAQAEGGASPRVLLVVDSLNVDGDVDHLRESYGRLLEALDRGRGGLSAVITLADDEWRVLAGVRAGALVQTLGPGRSKGLRQLLGRALKMRSLRLDGVSDADVDALGMTGQSPSSVLTAYADLVVAAAEGSPSYVTGLIDDLAATGAELVTWQSHDLPAGVVALRKRVLERSLASGQLPLIATVGLLERAVDGLSIALLDRLAEVLGAGHAESVDAAHRFCAFHCEAAAGRQSLSRAWKLAVQSWRQSAPAEWRSLQKKADTDAATFLDSLCADLAALDSDFRLLLFDDLISLRRYAEAFDVLRDPKLLPARERREFERHLRDAWRNEYGQRLYGLSVDPLEQPLLAECLEALLREDRRPSLCSTVANDPELSSHPLTLFYRAESGRLAAVSPGPRPDAAAREAVTALYQGALRASKELAFPAEFQLAVKAQQGLFLYDACGESDTADRIWSEVEMSTRRGARTRVRGLVLHYQGRSAFRAGHWWDADELYSEAWDRLFEDGDYLLLSRLATSMADAWAFLYDLPRAEERIAFSLDVKRLMGDRLGEAASLGVRANLEARKGNYAAAIRDFKADLTILESVDTPGKSDHIRIKMAEAHLKAGDLEEAETLLLRVERNLGGPDAPPELLGFCWKGMAKVRLAQGNPADAARRVIRLLSASPEPQPYLKAFLLRLAARIRAAGCWPRPEDTVEKLLGASQALFAREGLQSEEAVCELYRPLLSGDKSMVRPSAQKASSLLSQMVKGTDEDPRELRGVPGAAATLGPYIERLDCIASLDPTDIQEMEGQLREIITFFEY